MKTIITLLAKRLHRLGLLSLGACFFAALPARAGLTVDIHTYRYPTYYVTYGWLSTNTTPPAAPLGDYLIRSVNGSQLQYRYDTNGFNYITGGGVGTSDFSSYMDALTNGQWSIQVTNVTSTNTYYFNVSATGLSANLFNTATITAPANNAQNVSDDPTFTWSGGPIGWLGTAESSVHDVDYNYYESASLPASATSWNTPNPPLPLGTNVFQLVYLSNATAAIVASVPRDTSPSSNVISGWVSTANLEVGSDEVQFVVSHANAFDANLVARYNFEDTNSPGMDSSGNGNDANCGSGNGGTNLDTFSTDAAVGNFGREFFGDTSICFYPNGADCFNNLSNALYGSFSWTARVKTTNSVNADFANAYFGSPIWFEYGDSVNQAVFSITGSKAAFTVGNPGGGSDTTLHSTTSVNDGSYHFLAATRNEASGVMNLYVDGNLEATDVSTNGPRIAFDTMYLAGGYYVNFNGLLDDVRVYSTNLTASDVAVLAGLQPPVVDLVSNGGFETGDLSGWMDDGSGYVNTDYVHSGTYGAEFGAVGSLGYIYQTLSTTPGTNYLLSFWLDSPDGFTPNEFLVSWNGTTLLDETNLPAIGWTNIQFMVTATDASTVLEFGFRDDPSYLALDDVSVVTTNTVAAAPVLASFDLVLVRRENFIFGYHNYSAIPEITSISPIPVTTNRIESSDGTIFGEVYTGHSSWDIAQSSDYTTLDQLIYACTNGQWTLYVNKGDPSEQIFHFNISISGLTTNLLASVNVLMPTNNAVNVATNTPFQWAGPANFSSIFVNAYQFPSFASAGSANLPGNATSWPSPPTLSYGTNGFTIICTSNNFPNVTFTTPLDGSLNPVSSWSAAADLQSSTEIPFVVGAPAPLPVLLTNLTRAGGNLQFSFQTLAGRPHTIQARTNLATGLWIDLTNFVGDGSLKQFIFPTTNPPTQFFRVLTQ